MKIKITKAGRNSYKRNEYNDCTVRALAKCVGWSYSRTHKFLAKHGRKEGHMFDLRALLKTNPPEIVRKFDIKYSVFYGTGKFKVLSISDFVAKNPKGIFVLGIGFNHVISLRNGTVYDNYPIGVAEEVEYAWKFERKRK